MKNRAIFILNGILKIVSTVALFYLVHPLVGVLIFVAVRELKREIIAYLKGWEPLYIQDIASLYDNEKARTNILVC